MNNSVSVPSRTAGGDPAAFSKPPVRARIEKAIRNLLNVLVLLGSVLVSPKKMRFVWRNFLFFLVAIPYLHLVPYFQMNPASEISYIFRLMPLVRGGYGLAITVGWITRSKLTSLLVSYILIILSLTYFASLVFFMLEHPVNPAVTSYGEALWWAFMNVTTVGSNIFARTGTGEVLSVVLAASGMMLFPIFTVYITSRFQSHKQQGGQSGADEAGS